MKERKSGRPTRCYDLPGTRILARAARSRIQLAERFSVLNPGLEPEQARKVAENMIADLTFLRLAELRDILPPDTLRTLVPEKDDALPGFVSLLDELNQKAGLPLFEPRLYESHILPGHQISEFIRELRSKRFFPHDMPEEILGALLEVMSSRPPGPSDQRHTGRFYTPGRIVDKVLDEVLPLLLPQGSLMRKELYLLDPSCGSGNFLFAAYRGFLKHEERYLASRPSGLFYPLIRLPDGSRALEWPLRQKVLAEHIFGVDLDENALNAACRGLALIALRGFPILKDSPPPLYFLRKNLRQGDSLIDQELAQQAELFAPSLPRPLIPFVWQDREQGFGRILSSGGFHAVVGNPPWLSLKGRHRIPAYTPELVEHLLKEFRADTYRPNLFEIFIRRGVELLREGGYNSFVVPDRMAMNLQFQSLREFLLERGELLRLHFREPFPGVVADTLIYVFRKTTKPRRQRKLIVSDVDGMRREVSPRLLGKQKSAALLVGGEPDLSDLLRKIELAGRKPLREFFETGVGFIARPGKITSRRTWPDQRRVVKGGHVVPYKRRGEAHIRFEDRNLAGGTKNLSKLTNLKRILLRKTGPRLTAAIDETGDLPEQSLYFLNLRERRLCKAYDLHYFLGLLNSRLLNLYYRHRLITNPASTPQLKKVHLDIIPLRPIRFKVSEDRELYESLVYLVKERVLQSKDNPDLEERIDALVYDLYGLSERQLVDSLATPGERLLADSDEPHRRKPGPRK